MPEESKSKVAFINLLNKQGKPDGYEGPLGEPVPEGKYGNYLYEHDYHQFNFDYKKWITMDLEEDRSGVGTGSLEDPVVSKIIVDIAEKAVPLMGKVKKKIYRGRPMKKRKGRVRLVIKKKKPIGGTGRKYPNKKVGLGVEGVKKYDKIFDEIETDVPLPGSWQDGKDASKARIMKINDSIHKHTLSEAQAFSKACERIGYSGTYRKLIDGTYRIWKQPKKKSKKERK